MPVRKREGSFMTKPDEGWLHDDRGMKAGRGVFFSFPVKLVGSIRMETSLRSFSVDDQTDIAREAMIIMLNEMNIINRTGGPSKAGAGFKYGAFTDLGVEATVSVSAQGIIQAPPGADAQSGEDVGIINFHPMRLVSMAAGGENEYYDFVSYVAKDKETGVRECHVFDCGDFADEVLTTLGQAFVLAADLKRSKPKKKARAPAPPPKAPMAAVAEGNDDYGDIDEAPAIDAVNEAFAIPEDVQESLYDVANQAGDTAPTQEEIKADPVYDAAVAGPTADDIAAELMGLMTSEAQCIYETVQLQKPKPAARSAPEGLVDKLNEHDAVALKGAPAKQVTRPSWVYFKESETLKKIDHSELKKNFQIYGDVN